VVQAHVLVAELNVIVLADPPLGVRAAEQVGEVQLYTNLEVAAGSLIPRLVHWTEVNGDAATKVPPLSITACCARTIEPNI